MLYVRKQTERLTKMEKWNVFISLFSPQITVLREEPFTKTIAHEAHFTFDKAISSQCPFGSCSGAFDLITWSSSAIKLKMFRCPFVSEQWLAFLTLENFDVGYNITREISDEFRVDYFDQRIIIQVIFHATMQIPSLIQRFAAFLSLIS